MTLVLASGSPRRRELLARLGIPFIVEVPGVDESMGDGEDPIGYVQRIANAKALAAAGDGRVVIAADTAVVCDGAVLGKPGGSDEAAAMLTRLAGRSHTVVTGVAVAGPAGVRTCVERAVVEFRPLTAGEIDWYVATGEPLDKAGAYAAQGIGALLVTRIDGDPTAVAGLPLAATLALLRSAGVDLFTG